MSYIGPTRLGLALCQLRILSPELELRILSPELQDLTPLEAVMVVRRAMRARMADAEKRTVRSSAT